VPVALAVCGSFPAYYGSFRNILFDFSANSCCDGEMVQFVAPYLAGTATLIDYPVRRFPRSVASVGRVKSVSRHQGGGAPARESRADGARTCAVAQGRAPVTSTSWAASSGDKALAGSDIGGRVPARTPSPDLSKSSP
jgi:hypothetical protein